MFAPELAARLGYSTDYFRRHTNRLIIEKRMPTPLPALGWKRWDREKAEAWLAGMTPPAAANDAGMHGDDVAGQRAMLAQVYGRTG